MLAFRRIGLSEDAGWGLRDIFRSWRELGHVPPMIANNKGRKSFEVVLKQEALLSAEQLAFHRSLGLHLTEEQAEAFAFLCRAKTATMHQMRMVLGGTPEAVHKAVKSLETQQLLHPLEQGRTFVLAQHLAPLLDENGLPRSMPERPHTEDEATKIRPSDSLTQQQHRIVDVSDTPRTQTELASLTELSPTNFRQRHILPLVDANILRTTKPGGPFRRGQRYVLTKAGLKLKAARMSDNESADSG